MAQPNQYNEESYRRWRARIPYSDAQIIAAIEKWRADNSHGDKKTDAYITMRANSMRGAIERGYLSRSIFVAVLPYLVTHCAICDRSAHYRYGDEGRCREHRSVKPGWYGQWSARKDQKNAAASAQQNEFDQGMRIGDRLRRLASDMIRKGKQ